MRSSPQGATQVPDQEVVFVTGGVGFIGHRVCYRLIDLGYTPRIFDNMYWPDEKADELINDPRVEFVQGDVRYLHSIEAAMAGASTVLHLATLSINKSVVAPTESLEVNLLGADNVFRAAVNHGIKRVVFTSSASVYGEPDELPMSEDSPLKPQTPYCIAKEATERLLEFYGNHHDLDWNMLRFFNVYGPGQRIGAYYTSVINTFIKRIISGEAPMIDGDGSQTMDFVHVDDVANAIVLALTAERSREICNIGTNHETSIADLAQILLDALGSDLEPQFSPRKVLVTRRRCDWSKAEAVLGWKPTIDVSQGLSELAVHFARKFEAEAEAAAE